MAIASPRNRVGVAAVAVLGALALAQHWFEDRRPPAPESRALRELVVTNGDDSGEGSLREAIFLSASLDGRARILLRTPLIRLRSPLPPLVNPNGVSIEADGPAEVDLAALVGGVALEVRGARSQLVGVTLANAPEVALRVAATDFRLAASQLRANGLALHVLPEAHGLVVEGTRFEANGTGLRMEAAVRGASVRDSRFSAHREVAIWLVRPDDTPLLEAERLAIAANRFESDRVSIVIGNAPVAVERNEFIANREVAILMVGSGASARHNIVRDGQGIGILAQGAPRSSIEANEVSRNRALGMMVRASGGTTVQDNRIYGNGYGMAFVLGEAGNPVLAHGNTVMGHQYDGIVVIGDSPVIRGNRSMSNGQAGVRLFDLALRDAPRVVSAPFLQSNTVSGNVLNEVMRGEYRIDAEKASR